MKARIIDNCLKQMRNREDSINQVASHFIYLSFPFKFLHKNSIENIYQNNIKRTN